MGQTKKIFFPFVVLLGAFLLFQNNITAQSRLYVDNVNGSDDYNGLSQHATSESGPKKTITNAVNIALDGDTIIVVNTGQIYGSQSDETDTLKVTKEITFESLDGKITLDAFLLIDSTNHVLFNGRYELLRDLTITGNLELNDTLSLKANLNLPSSDTLNVDFKAPLVFNGENDQIITVPAEGAKIGSFEIAKPSGDIILEGGNLDLSKELVDTNYNRVIFRKGLFITGDNTLILQAPAGTPELGFLHDPLPGDISHVVGTVGIDPKIAFEIAESKTIWPVGSLEVYRPYSMYIRNTVDMNLNTKLFVSHVLGKLNSKLGLPVELNEKSYTFHPDFYWHIESEIPSAFISLEYDMEFTLNDFIPDCDFEEMILLKFHEYSSSYDNFWFLVNYYYEHDVNKSTLRSLNTRGGISYFSKYFTIGLPTHLSIIKELPDLIIDYRYQQTVEIDLDSVFVGNQGEFTYSAQITNEMAVHIADEEFTDPLFVIHCLSDGSSDIVITATDSTGDFIITSFLITVDVFPTEDLEDEIIPLEYSLSQNYPNPFNPETTIRFGLPETASVSLKIYNVLGEAVKTLVSDEELRTGYHQYNFDGSSVSSGIYFCKLEAGKYRLVKKMILLK